MAFPIGLHVWSKLEECRPWPAYVIRKRQSAQHEHMVPVHFYGPEEEFAWVPQRNVEVMSAASLLDFVHDAEDDEGFCQALEQAVALHTFHCPHCPDAAFHDAVSMRSHVDLIHPGAVLSKALCQARFDVYRSECLQLLAEVDPQRMAAADISLLVALLARPSPHNKLLALTDDLHRAPVARCTTSGLPGASKPSVQGRGGQPTCQVCGKVFAGKPALYGHMRIHRTSTVSPAPDLALQRPATATPTQRTAAGLPDTPVTPTTFPNAFQLLPTAELLRAKPHTAGAVNAGLTQGQRLPGHTGPSNFLQRLTAAADVAIATGGHNLFSPRDSLFLSPPTEAEDALSQRHLLPLHFTVSPPPLLCAPVASERDRMPQINVGPFYQAYVPAITGNNGGWGLAEPDQQRSELVWHPDVAINHQPSFHHFLDFVTTSALFDGVSHDQRLELAHEALHTGFTGPEHPGIPLMTATLLKLTGARSPLMVRPSHATHWTSEEKTTFWEGLIRHGKQFKLIQRMLGTKPLAAIIQFYYLEKHKADNRVHMEAYCQRRAEDRARCEAEGVVVCDRCNTEVALEWFQDDRGGDFCDVCWEGQPHSPKPAKAKAKAARAKASKQGSLDGTSKLSCTYCGKCFLTANSLYGHMRVHADQKAARLNKSRTTPDKKS